MALQSPLIDLSSSYFHERIVIMFLQEGFKAEGCPNVSSSPPFFFGSPPCRAPNPLVQDAHFRVEKPKTTVSSPSDSASRPSARSPAVVRVEGFDCRSPHVFAMTLNSWDHMHNKFLTWSWWGWGREENWKEKQPIRCEIITNFLIEIF